MYLKVEVNKDVFLSLEIGAADVCAVRWTHDTDVLSLVFVIVGILNLALACSCRHIYEYCVGTHRIILPRGSGYGFSRVGNAQIQTMNRQNANLCSKSFLDKNNTYNLYVTANQIALHRTRFTRCTIKVIISQGH